MAVATTTYSLDGLQTRLAEHKKCFDSLVELIPPKYYFQQNLDADLNNRFMHNKKGKAPKQAVKDATKKAKKQKLDPESSKTVLEVQSEQLKAANEEVSTQAHTAEATAEEPAELASGLKPLPAGSIVELQAKLKSRIEELRAKRNGGKSTSSDAKEAKTPRSRQEILEGRAQRKQERKESIKKQKEKRKKLDDTTGMDTVEKTVVERPGKRVPVVEEDVQFGKLDFGVTEPSKKRKGPTDIAGQLKQAEAKRAKLAHLAETDTSKAEAITEKQTWSKVLAQAQGEKVKDDVKLLKKSLKRREHEKAKSSAVWADRERTLKKDKEQKMKKREENIKARAEAKRDPKAAKAARLAAAKKKKAKARPGFEGGGPKNGKK
ncbi:surfeit locus protein 6-domain-containing protein [Fimicolochytrium jonesii]|uniref:surfeit locus protein 6-domain-containing protein n=1 Tax=Fimicolochytrium jonesii TaxID=1396493 RepID=UPI0022FE84E0|nr:surfeit locus protein 6-domain-containing protein [Fimicolochytrium jonesii]KAI8824517.1 surfeit locus protein 6-domain-containing protein [Fimicolochytrium jonesii]